MLEVAGLRHRYAAAEALALDHWRVARGEHWLVLGDSGSGKTTLLHILAGLVRPSEGRITIAATDLATLSGAALDRFRGRHIGFVPQKLHLIASLTVIENLLLAQSLAGLPPQPARAMEVLAALALADKAPARPTALSHGQAQRVAVARAVINRPAIILADEPTSNLDDRHCAATLDLLEAQARACGSTLVIATHDRRVKTRTARRLDLPSPGADEEGAAA